MPCLPDPFLQVLRSRWGRLQRPQTVNNTPTPTWKESAAIVPTLQMRKQVLRGQMASEGGGPLPPRLYSKGGVGDPPPFPVGVPGLDPSLCLPSPTPQTLSLPLAREFWRLHNRILCPCSWFSFKPFVLKKKKKKKENLAPPLFFASWGERRIPASSFPHLGPRDVHSLP